MRIRRSVTVAVGAGAIALALASSAIASTKTIQDRKGDSKAGHADIKSVTATSSTHYVTWPVMSYTTFKTKNAPCVGIAPGTNSHPQGDTYEVCGDGTIQNFAHGTVAGHATVHRPNSKTVIYKVSRAAIGHPKAIAWIVQVRESPGCFPNICDQAPNGPGQHIVQHL